MDTTPNQVFNNVLEWVDAQEMSEKHPTFQAPLSKDLYSLESGDWVKICNQKQRFWVKIIQIEKTPLRRAKKWKFIGRVDNQLPAGLPYQLGSWVEFGGRHIYQIMSKAAMNQSPEQDSLREGNLRQVEAEKN